jgi:hypothetical protein
MPQKGVHRELLWEWLPGVAGCPKPHNTRISCVPTMPTAAPMLRRMRANIRAHLHRRTASPYQKKLYFRRKAAFIDTFRPRLTPTKCSALQKFPRIWAMPRHVFLPSFIEIGTRHHTFRVKILHFFPLRGPHDAPMRVNGMDGKPMVGCVYVPKEVVLVHRKAAFLGRNNQPNPNFYAK